jgi:hypothetical protein
MRSQPPDTPRPISYPGHTAQVRFEFPGLALLSDESKQLGLESLLSRRPCNIYSSMEVFTLGALVELAAKGFKQVPGYGRKCYTETEALLRAAASAVNSNGDINLTALYANIGRPFIKEASTGLHEDLGTFISTQFPVLIYTTEKLERLSESAKRQSLSNLHLDSRAATTMEKLGVADVACFAEKMKQGINANELRNFGRKAFRDLASAITALSSSIDDQGNCDWITYASMRGFKILPARSLATTREAVEQLAEIVEQAVKVQFGAEKHFSRKMDVFKRRLHAPVGDHLTLEQLGDLHSLTRERIRQNEMHIVSCLSASLLQGKYSVPTIRGRSKSYDALRFRFRPPVERALQSAKAALDKESRRVWRLDEWLQFLSGLWCVDQQYVEYNALLLSNLFGFSVEFQTADEKTGVALVIADDVPTSLKQELRDILDDIHLSMQSNAEGLSAVEILAPLYPEKVLKELALKPNELTAFSPVLCQVHSGMWKIKPEFFKPKIGKMTCDVVYSILSEHGSRMHHSQLLRRFKLRHPELLENDRLLTARIFRDDRFQSVGRTGYWVLSEWNQETGTVREVIGKVLAESNKPMHVNDILRAVRARVPCSENSVRAYLLECPEKYIKLSSVTYGLASRYPNRLCHEEF